MIMADLKYKKGDILIGSLIFGAVALFIVPALVNLAATNLKTTSSYINKHRALQIAEAGIDYYKWHLAYAPTDYKDGGTTTGPYTHDFFDKDGNTVGQYILDITAPPTGSTLVKIKSTGKVNDDSSITKVVEEELAIPSLAQYAIVANDNMRFGSGTIVIGPVRSNGGIRLNEQAL